MEAESDEVNKVSHRIEVADYHSVFGYAVTGLRNGLVRSKSERVDGGTI